MKWLQTLFLRGRAIGRRGWRNIPEVNMSVVVRALDSGHHSMAVVFDVAAGGVFWLLFPDGESLSAAELGNQFRLEYRTAEDLFGLVVKLDQVVTDKHPISGLPLVRVGMRALRPPEKVQRRKFRRLDVTIPVAVYSVLIPNSFAEDPVVRESLTRGWLELPPEIAENAQMMDLSGGGASLHLRSPAEMGNTLFGEFKLRESVIWTAMKVVQVASPRGQRSTVVGVEFLGLDDDFRNDILDFVEEETSARLEPGRKRKPI